MLDLATYLPVTKNELPHISGFGAFKIEKYGAPFLETIQDYCHENGLVSLVQLKQPKRTKSTTVVKERATGTKRTSYEMYRDGRSVTEISAARQLALTTVETHLSYYVSTGELEIHEFVNRDKQEMIEEAITKYGSLSLKVLKDNLPENISYGEIRMMVAYLTR